MPLDRLTPKIADFGLAHFVDVASDTRSGVPIGTTAYMSPEQARGDLRRIGPVTDVYGLGAILYQVLIGRPPFRGATDADTTRQVIDNEPEPPRRERRDISTDLQAVTLKCLEKDPARRYRSAAALAHDLRRFLDGRPTVARPIGRFDRLVRWARRNPPLAAATGLAAVTLIAVSIVSALWAVRERDNSEDMRQARATASAIRVEVLLRGLRDLGTNLRVAVLNAEPEFTEPYERTAQQVTHDIRDLQKQVGDNPEQVAQLQALATAVDKWLASHADTIRLVRDGQRLQAVRRARQQIDAQDEVRRAVRNFVDTSDRIDREQSTALEQTRPRQQWLLLAGLASSLIITGLLLFVFTRILSGRLALLTDNAQRLAAGKALAPPARRQ
jgi:CHASE3 domain sensor protein